MNKKYIVRLNEQERTELEELTSKGKAAAYKIKHANVLLKADADGPNWTDEQISEAFSLSTKAVGQIRQRLVERGLKAAINRKTQERPSRYSKFDGQAEAKLIALSCSSPPEGNARWTFRLLADKAVELQIVDSVSHETVRQTLKKTRLSHTCGKCG